MRRVKKNLLIETFDGVAAEDAKRVEGMTKEERGRYFEDWVRQRATAENVDGVYLLVCRRPSHVQLEVSRNAGPLFGDQARKQQLVDLVLAEFDAKHFDAGLLAAVAFVRENLPAEGRAR
jgi:hypothetical protein